jgi:hypothetical protein
MPAAGAFRPWKPPDQSPLTYGSVKDLGAVRLQARDFTDGVSRLCSREPFSRRSAANPHKRPKDSHAEQNLLRYQKRAQDTAIIECIVRALAILAALFRQFAEVLGRAPRLNCRDRTVEHV